VLTRTNCSGRMDVCVYNTIKGEIGERQRDGGWVNRSNSSARSQKCAMQESEPCDTCYRSYTILLISAL
jgi:hypothetical protein